jgi:hypothetical protein
MLFRYHYFDAKKEIIMRKNAVVVLSFLVFCGVNSHADEKKIQAATNALNATANFLNALNGSQNGSNQLGQSVQNGHMRNLCVGNNFQTYHNCIGTHVYPNGNIYAGEFVNGQRHGMGMIRVLAGGVPSDHYIGSNVPSTYVGQFANDRINGYGNWSTDTGQSFNGEYLNNILVRIVE